MAVDELEESEAVEEKESGKKKRQQIIILAILGVILLTFLAGIVALYFYFFVEETEQYRIISRFEAEFNQVRQTEVVRLLKPKYVKSQIFTINLKGGRKYLKIKLAYALQDSFAVTFLERKLPILDDMVISYIQSQSAENLRSRHGMEMLKLNLMMLSNSIFTDDYLLLSETKDRLPVKQVLITRYFLN